MDKCFFVQNIKDNLVIGEFIVIKNYEGSEDAKDT